ncbi:MAG: tetratricopeptide repeat protein [Acidobacteriota bacterium]
MSSVRWIITALTVALVVAAGSCSTRRLVGATLRGRADRDFYQGDVDGALATYEAARRWSPGAARADTDVGDAVVAALGRLGAGSAGSVPELATRGLAAYLAAIDAGLPGAWSWAGVAQIYDHLRAQRKATGGLDLSALSPDPEENLSVEDRLSEAALRQALAFDPRNFFYLDALGELFWSTGREKEALDIFQEAALIHPVLGDHYYILDGARRAPEIARAAAGGLSEALAVASPVDRWMVLAETARLATLEGDGDTAGAAYRCAIDASGSATSRQRAHLHFQLAQVLEGQGRLDEAVLHLSEAAALEPLRALYRAALGRGEGTLGRHDDAMRDLGAAQAIEPGNVSFVRAYAGEARRGGDIDRAERAYRDMFRLEPDRDEPYLHLIDMFRKNGMPGRAIPYARELSRRHPDEPIYARQVEQLYDEEANP